MPGGFLLTVPDSSYLDELGDLPACVRTVVWDLTSEAPEARIDLVVLPGGPNARVEALQATKTELVQSVSIGFDHLIGRIPVGHRVANGRTVYESGTAELTLALLLAAQRDLVGYAAAARAHRWEPPRIAPGLSGRRVLLLGYGGIGQEVERRLTAFDVQVTRVGRSARASAGRPVESVADLPELLPQTEILVNSLPLDASTRRLLGAKLLGLLPAGALVVNVGRGGTIDTAALVAEVSAGRLRAALDVVDPEPVPAGHVLWSLPGLILTPHVGGMTSEAAPRTAALIRRQISALLTEQEPENVVIDLRHALAGRNRVER